MLVPFIQTPTMSLPPASQSPPKRPRLSLQIKNVITPSTLGKSQTALKADIDPSSPTAFNTLSNAYATAIENASPATARPPVSAVRTRPTSLRLQTALAGDGYKPPSQRTQTPGPYSIVYPDTPSSAIEELTPVTAHPKMYTTSETPITYTPPQSAGTSEQPAHRVFTFTANQHNPNSPGSPRTPRRRATIGNHFQVPYTHPRSLRSILRNSPLPPRSSVTPATPSRMSMRIANRAAKKVGYGDPLTQTIVTNKYVKSHIELLEESPASAVDPEKESMEMETLDVAMTYTGDETKDGGQTPGPFEEMRRRMAGLEAEKGPDSPKTRRRKRKEKKRKWVWTIGVNEDDEPDPIIGTPTTAILDVERTPATAIWRGQSVDTDSEKTDSEMSEISEVSESEDRPVTSHSI
ncbi:hypothetical protein F5884DRAFT_287059 [Xylogone sp. PMI_703]|nr:hypothetical protein F5884DRAFT_287059 [Xylogone sp. PMI_703]